MKATEVEQHLKEAIKQRKEDQANLESKLSMEISHLSEKVDEVCTKLTDHIERQDKFEESIYSKMEDLGYLLRVFRWIGWAITVATSAAIIWYVNHFLTTGHK